MDAEIFQSTRLSRASTEWPRCSGPGPVISIHKALASLDLYEVTRTKVRTIISIHKALASLDSIFFDNIINSK